MLAGASLDFTAIQSIGFIGGVYVVSRIVGKVLGAWVGGVSSNIDAKESSWIGHVAPSGSSHGDGFGRFQPVSGVPADTTDSRCKLDHIVRAGGPYFYSNGVGQI